MERSAVSRYGWMIALLAVAGLWYRTEVGAGRSRAVAAPPAANINNAPFRPATIAVLDVAAVFKQFRKFNDTMNKVKEDIETFDGYVKEQSEELRIMGVEHQRLKPGTPAEQELRSRIELLTKTLQDQVAAKKALLLQDEAGVYFDHYAAVQAAARTVARKRRIDYVIRFNADEMQRGNRDSVLQGVNRAVVVCPDGHDITSDIVTILNES